jgi:hypothetical protein
VAICSAKNDHAQLFIIQAGNLWCKRTTASLVGKIVGIRSNQLKKEDNMPTNLNPQHKEGKVATAIEEQTAKIPSDVFLWAALGSMAVSLGLQLFGQKHRSLFIGQWAPSFLLLGIYNKIVKLEGHD